MQSPLLQEHPPPPAIHPLPPSTQSLLRSTSILPSLPSLALELAHNALDAQATRITLTVDLDTWSLRADDNGTGIEREQLAQLAQGGRYSTSKLLHEGTADARLGGVETYGFRGEALASMADVGVVEIKSRAVGEDITHELVLRDGEVLSLGVSKSARATQGTTVCVRDIFGKFPVRRRPYDKPSAQQTLLNSLRTSLSELALVHPSVAFSLVDTTSSSAADGEGKTLLSVARASEGIVGRWRQIWGRAGVEKVWEFDEVEGVRAKGFFSLSAAQSKAGQYVFVNSRPLSSFSSPLHKVLNTVIGSSSFARYATSHLSLPSSPRPSPSSPSPMKKARQRPKKAAERHPVFVVALEVPSGWVDVSLEPEKRVVEFVDPDRITTFLTSLTKRFLIENGFANITSTTSAAPTIPSLAPSPVKTPRKRPSSTSTVPAALTAPRTASALKRPRTEPAPPPPTLPFPSQASSRFEAAEAVEPLPPLRWIEPLTRQPFLIDQRTGNSWKEGTRPDLEGQMVGDGEKGCVRCGEGRRTVKRRTVKRRTVGGDEAEGEEKGEKPKWLREALEDWQNPIFPISSTSGEARVPTLPPLSTTLSAPGLPSSSSSSRKAATLSSAFTSTKPSLSSSSTKRSASSAPLPLTGNRVQAMTAFFSSTSSLASPSSFPSTSPSSSAEPASLLPASSAIGGGGEDEITRESLGQAEFVAQVDAKFLLVGIPPLTGEGGGTLVLVDQHAASERVRVEQFWEALAGRVGRGEEVEVVRIPPPGEKEGEQEKEEGGRPLGVVVAREEAEDVKKWEGEFARWGFRFLFPSSSPSQPSPPTSSTAPPPLQQSYAQLFLLSLPSLLAPRLYPQTGLKQAQEEGRRLVQEVVRGWVGELRERRAAPVPLLGEAEEGAREREGGKDGKEKGERRERSWVNVVKEAPVGVVELVNSKACRGAVMFNDSLTPAQSRSLLSAFAQTTFPFQCAHGRPSLVPLVRLPGAGRKTPGEKVDWGKFA